MHKLRFGGVQQLARARCGAVRCGAAAAARAIPDDAPHSPHSLASRQIALCAAALLQRAADHR
jgi:hypothetical protein